METVARLRFHSHPWTQQPLKESLDFVLMPVQQEPGCLGARVMVSEQDPRDMVLETRWVDESAFRTHATMSHTEGFLARVKPLVDQALQLDVQSAR